MRIKKFDEKFTNFTEGDYLPQEMAFADLMSDADLDDRFDVSRSFYPESTSTQSDIVVYRFKIETAEWVNDGLRSVRYTDPKTLYEDHKKRFDFVEEIYIACSRTEEEYPEVELKVTEANTVSTGWNNMCIEIKMFIHKRKK